MYAKHKKNEPKKTAKKESIGGLSIVLPVPMKKIYNSPAMVSHTALTVKVMDSGVNDFIFTVKKFKHQLLPIVQILYFLIQDTLISISLVRIGFAIFPFLYLGSCQVRKKMIMAATAVVGCIHET